MDRRRFLRIFGLGATAAAGTPAMLALTSSPAAASLLTGPDASAVMHDIGVGMYTDMSTANQMSTFTIEPTLVTCGVGTFGVAAAGQSGPFAMLMYSVNIASYNANHMTAVITATGRMRSITRVSGLAVENVEHDFIAIAVDNRGIGPDRFDVHFTTPFWSPSNPLATPSSVHPGWSRFGGNVVADPATGANPTGGVTVG
jgi:hypothetical protein